MKKLIFLLLALSLLITSCVKNKNIAANAFIIDGVSDVDMGDTSAKALLLSITSTSGNPEVVALSASGLPAGISVSFTPQSGTPPFNTIATFSGTAVGGVYPFIITGTTASTTNNYNCSLMMPQFSGWTIDSKTYKAGRTSIASYMGYYSFDVNSSDEYSSISFYKYGAFPTAGGIYRYRLTGPDFHDSSRVVAIFRPLNNTLEFKSVMDSSIYLTLVINSGKARFTLPATVLTGSYPPGPITTKTLTADISY